MCLCAYNKAASEATSAHWQKQKPPCPICRFRCVAMELHFNRATDPAALAAKLNGTLLFRRNRGVASAHGCDVRCSFEGEITKQKLTQACAMTFRHWAADASLAYVEHHVVDKRLAASQSAASSSDAVPANQVARRTGVEDMKAMSQGMSRSECHSLAVYFALRAAEPAQGHSEMGAILALKLRASHAFLGPVATWASEIEKHIPAVPPPVQACQCRCGCTNLATSLMWCMRHCRPECSMGSGRRAVCAQCLHDNGSCHICTPTPKRAGRLVPPVPEKPKLPVNWYFNEPDNKPWVVRTRDTALDPQLLLIKEVIKTHDLSTAKSRSARPHGWERSLVAKCVLADPLGGSLKHPSAGPPCWRMRLGPGTRWCCMCRTGCPATFGLSARSSAHGRRWRTPLQRQAHQTGLSTAACRSRMSRRRMRRRRRGCARRIA